MRNLWKKGLSMLVTLSMVLSLMPTMAFAAECSHEHDEGCGYVAAQEEISCGHECGEDCAEGCIHEMHDDACGYKEAVAEQPCTYVHGVECGCEEEIPDEREEETAAHEDCGDCLVCEVADMINDLPDAEDITEENAAEVIDQIHAIDRVKFDLTDDEYLELMKLIELETPDFGMAVPARYQAAVAAILALEDGAEFYVTKEFLSVDGSDVDVTDAEVTFVIEGEGYSETITMTTMDYVLNSLSADSDFYSEEASGWTYKYILPAGTYTITEVSDKGATVEGKDFVTGSVSGEVDGEAFEGDTATFIIEDGRKSVVAFDNSLPGGGDTSSASCGFWHTCHMTTDDEGNPIDGECDEFTADTTELTVPEGTDTIYYCMTEDVTLNDDVSVGMFWDENTHPDGVWIILCTGGHTLNLNGYDFIVDDSINDSASAVAFEIVDDCSNSTDVNDITNDIPIYVEWKDWNDAQGKRPEKDGFSVVVTDDYDISETVSFEEATVDGNIWTATLEDAVAYRAVKKEWEDTNKWRFDSVGYSVRDVENSNYGDYQGPFEYMEDDGTVLKPWNHVYMKLDMPTTEINLEWKDENLPKGLVDNNVVVTLYADNEAVDKRSGKLTFDTDTNHYKVVYGDENECLNGFYDEEDPDLMEFYDFYKTDDVEAPVYTLGVIGLPDGYEAEVTGPTIEEGGGSGEDGYTHTFTITLQAKTTKYTITCEDVENGTVTADKNEAAEGDTVTITATPDEYYKLDKLTVTGVDNKDITDNGDGTYTFLMPASDVTVTVKFERIKATFMPWLYQVLLTGETVTVKEVELLYNYTVNLVDVETDEKQTDIKYGEYTNVYAGKYYTVELGGWLKEKRYDFPEDAENKFYFDYEISAAGTEWGVIKEIGSNFGYSGGSGDILNVILKAPCNILTYEVEWDGRIPEADKKGITLRMAATGDGVKFNSDGETNMGTITVAEEGTTTIQAVKYDSYGTEITGYSHTATEVDGWNIKVTQDTAATSKYIILVAPVEHNITVTENVNGSITVDDNRTTAAKGEKITFSAAANEGYRLIDVSVTDAEVTYDEETGRYSFIIPDKEVTISAEIKKVHSITIPTEMPEGVDTVTVDKEEAVEGETVTITGPGFAAGYELDTLTYIQTSGDTVTITENDGSYSFTMPDGDVTVKATAKKTALTVSADSEIANGTVTFGENKEETLTAYVGDTITVTVTPNENYGAVSVTTTPDTEKTIVIPESGEVFTFTFTMPAESVEVSATFAALIGIDTDGDNDVDKYVPGVDDDGDGIYEDADGNEIYLPVDNDTEDDADHYVPDGVLKDEDAEGKKDGLWTPGGDNDGPFYVPVYEDDDANPDGFIFVTEETDNDGVYEDADGNEYIPDQDGDGKPEVDEDGDGIFEGTDDEKDNDYIPSGDKDGDGKNDDYYVDGNGDGVFTEQDETTGGEKDDDDITYIPDQDGDGIAEPDTNGDSVYEGTEDTDSNPDNQPDNTYIPSGDKGGDGENDDYYVDADGDGIFGEQDENGAEKDEPKYVPDDDEDGKPEQVTKNDEDGTYTEADGDGDDSYLPDQDGDRVAEKDDDGDGIFDGTKDDTTYIPDKDGDDKPEPDANGDGIYEGTEGNSNYIPVVDGSDPAKAPSDEDKKKDDAVVDDNKDGIYDEMNGDGDEDGTNDTYYVPVDSNDDGKIDGVKEVTKDGDVYVDEDGTEYIPDQNGDGLPEVDADGDGIFEDADGNRYNEDGSDYVPSTPSSSSNRGSTKYNIVVEETENGVIKSSDRTAKKGETITLTVTPDGEFDLRSLKVVDRNGNKIDLKDNGDGTYTFKMPRSSVTVTGSFAEEDLTTIILTIDSRIIWIDEEMIVYDVAPMIRNERTVLPIRVIAEALGASVAWNEPAQKVTIIKGDTVIELFINQPYALVNGTPVLLDAPAFIENSRTYLPIRFISENLGASVVWDGLARTVTITD